MIINLNRTKTSNIIIVRPLTIAKRTLKTLITYCA